LLLFARPRDIEPQPKGSAICDLDAGPLGTLMVAQSAPKPAGMDFDAAGDPARYKEFHFTVHLVLLGDVSVPL
jgi:hypothetical protein